MDITDQDRTDHEWDKTDHEMGQNIPSDFFILCMNMPLELTIICMYVEISFERLYLKLKKWKSLLNYFVLYPRKVRNVKCTCSVKLIRHRNGS